MQIQKKEAEDAAKRIIELSPYDACDCEIEAYSKELSLLSLGNIKNHQDYFFLAPDKNGCFDWFEFEEFKSFISDEKLEEIRIKKLEENNGQLSLLKSE